MRPPDAPGDQESDEGDDVTETLAEEGRQVLYSMNEDDEQPADTDEWIASDTTVSGSDQQ